MWGGGMMFNEIVLSPEGKEILDEFGVRTEQYHITPPIHADVDELGR